MNEASTAVIVLRARNAILDLLSYMTVIDLPLQHLSHVHLPPLDKFELHQASQALFLSFILFPSLRFRRTELYYTTVSFHPNSCEFSDNIEGPTTSCRK